MTITGHNQSGVGSHACGASCILCAGIELGVLKGQPDDPRAKAIYQEIRKGEDDDSLVSKVIAKAQDIGLNCKLVELIDLDTLAEVLSGTGIAGLQAKLEEYLNDVVSIGRSQIETAGLLDKGSRLMIVVMLVPGGETHWLLARQKEGKILVMDPASGKNSEVSDLLDWIGAMPNGAPEPKVIEGRSYLSTGIVLHLTKP